VSAALSPAETRTLLEQAARARYNARVPQSGFRVGAALLCAGGTVVTGCNVEISGTLYSICAERTAVVKAVSEGQQDFTALAVVSDAARPVAPCGFCRQVLADFNIDMPVYMANADLTQTAEMTVRELCPMAFDVRSGSG
jgi:cytidine deaminase